MHTWIHSHTLILPHASRKRKTLFPDILQTITHLKTIHFKTHLQQNTLLISQHIIHIIQVSSHYVFQPSLTPRQHIPTLQSTISNPSAKTTTSHTHSTLDTPRKETKTPITASPTTTNLSNRFRHLRHHICLQIIIHLSTFSWRTPNALRNAVVHCSTQSTHLGDSSTLESLKSTTTYFEAASAICHPALTNTAQLAIGWPYLCCRW